MSTTRPKKVRQNDQSTKTGKPESEASINVNGDDLMDRVVSILEQARANVVRAVNSNMVIAYWLIGREIVHELQRGEERAEYGKQVIENLSKQLTRRYGSGYSVTTLQYFRKFYQAYSTRSPIPRPLGAESSAMNTPIEISRPMGAELTIPGKSYHPGSEFKIGFSQQLTWSHYRALMRVE